MSELLISRLGQHFVYRKTDWMLSSMMAHVGLLLLWKPDLYHEAVSLITVRHLISSEVAALLCLSVGVLRIITLVLKALTGPSPAASHLRFAMSIFSCLVWGHMILSVYVAEHIVRNAGGVGLAIFPWLLIFELINTFSSARDVGKYR